MSKKLLFTIRELIDEVIDFLYYKVTLIIHLLIFLLKGTIEVSNIISIILVNSEDNILKSYFLKTI